MPSGDHFEIAQSYLKKLEDLIVDGVEILACTSQVKALLNVGILACLTVLLIRMNYDRMSCVFKRFACFVMGGFPNNETKLQMY